MYEELFLSMCQNMMLLKCLEALQRQAHLSSKLASKLYGRTHVGSHYEDTPIRSNMSAYLYAPTTINRGERVLALDSAEVQIL